MELRLTGRERWVPYTFILPALMGLILFQVAPFFIAIFQTIHPLNPLTGETRFVGLAVYQALFSDPEFYHAILVTILFTIIINPFQAVISFVLALAVYKKGMVSSIFRTLYFLPVGSSITITSIIWGLMMDPNGGLLNGFLRVFDIPSQRFLSSPHEALWAIVLMATWNGCGYWMVFFLAGLHEIDPVLYEAAEIDGAGTFTKLAFVTLPSLLRTIAFVFISDTVINFLLFSPIYILTQGGPNNSTDVLMYYAYNHAFGMGELPMGLAASVVLLIIVMLFVAIELRLTRVERSAD